MSGDRASVAVLLIEDDASMARLVRHLLELDGYRQIRHVWSAELALPAARDAEIILLDHQLPDVRGLDLLPQLLTRADPPSVIMVTGHGSESLAAAALRLGAEDYLTKDHTLPELLPRILERVRRHRALRSALADAERELVQAERLAALGEMSVTLHHELNNPLMAAMAEIELALGDDALGEPHREGLETARAALRRIAERLRQVAELRRADATDYLDGMKMIALEGGESVPAPFRGKALLCHPDQRVLRVLSLLLRNAGFLVERVLSPSDLASAAQDPAVTLLAMAGAPETDHPLGGFLPPDTRPYLVAVLGTGSEPAARAAGADHFVAMPFDPELVVSDLITALERRNTPSP